MGSNGITNRKEGWSSHELFVLSCCVKFKGLVPCAKKWEEKRRARIIYQLYQMVYKSYSLYNLCSKFFQMFLQKTRYPMCLGRETAQSK